MVAGKTFFALVVMLFGLVVNARDIKFDTKQSTGADILKMELWPCQNGESGSDPCFLKPGQFLNSRITFSTKQIINDFVSSNAVVVFGRAFPVAEVEGCTSLAGGASCPLAADQTYIFEGNSTVTSSIPGIVKGLTFQCSLKEGDDTLVAIEFPIKLKA